MNLAPARNSRGVYPVLAVVGSFIDVISNAKGANRVLQKINNKQLVTEEGNTTQ